MSTVISDFTLGCITAVVTIAAFDFGMARIGRAIAAYKTEREKTKKGGAQ